MELVFILFESVSLKKLAVFQRFVLPLMFFVLQFSLHVLTEAYNQN